MDDDFHSVSVRADTAMTADDTPTRIYLCQNRNGHPRFEEVGPDDIGAEAWVKEGAGVWPDFIAPPMYENADARWEDPKLPDFRLIWRVARECGYSIGLHGSMKRDCDMIAAPWTEEAVIAFDLIDRLCAALNAKQVGKVAGKPHGRLGWSLQIDGWFKVIDISVLPRACDMKSGKVAALEPVAQPETPTPGQFETMCLAIEDVVTGRGFDVDPWQPIEMCPEDCGMVLVTDGDHATPAIRYNGAWRFWGGETVDDWKGDAAGDLNWWIEGYGPTHWMPFPKPGETTSAIPEAVKAYLRNALMVGGWRGEE